MKRKTAIAYHPVLLSHFTGPSHPESTNRLEHLIETLKGSKINRELDWIKIKPAHRDIIEKNHSANFVDQVDAFAKLRYPKFIDNDTIACASTGRAAYTAVGAIVDAIDFSMHDTFANAFCAVRPPGHHAEYDHAMGFCFFNTVAIGAHYALEKYSLDRIAIIDWDVHHGNGTQNSFYQNSKVFYISLHERSLFPGTGLESENGENEGTGFNLNIPLSPGTTVSRYWQVFKEQIIPRLRAYAPELIFVSAGFDAHIKDPLSSLRLSTSFFGELTDSVMAIADEFCDGRIVSCLEGGYDIEALSESALCHISKLRQIDV